MYKNILVPVDGSATSNAGLDEAIKLAQLLGARLRLLHVVDEMPYISSIDGYAATMADLRGLLLAGGEQILANAKAAAMEKGVQADTVLIDALSERITEHVIRQAKAWEADLIVLGTHGRRGVGRMLMGSDAEQVMRQSPVPVLLVRCPQAAAVPSQPTN